MKIWVDDIRPAPAGYTWCKSVNETIHIIQTQIMCKRSFPCDDGHYDIELIDIDHDAGAYTSYGGDYINILNWLEKNNFNYPIRIHSMNVVGVENMRRIIRRNNWKEII